MKRAYETPRAEKLDFRYEENVVAYSGRGNGGNANPNAAPQAENSCYTHNTSEVVTRPNCKGRANPKGRP